MSRAPLQLVWLLILPWAAAEAQDLARDAELNRKAAKAGSSRDQFALGLAYMAGRGVPQDEALATTWFRTAAEQGHTAAQYRLALAYEMGVGVKRDLAEAADWYRPAAERGHEASQLQLGLLLSNAREPDATDYPEAVRWLTLAAERGNAEAAMRLGFVFARGLAGTKEYARAIPLLEQASRAGIADAHFELGLIYEKGRGFIDPIEARRQYKTAVDNGFMMANERLSYDPRLRERHRRGARIYDGSGADSVRTPEEIRQGPAAPVPLAPGDDVYCDFYPRSNDGGNPKFRCFMKSGPGADGGVYYDAAGNLRPEADGLLVLDTDSGPRPVLARVGKAGRLVPLTDREGFARTFARPLELKVKYRSLDDPDLVGNRDMYTEVAATRLMWALHFPADRMYRVGRVHCERCPRDPYRDREPAPEGESTTFDDVAIELRYRAGHVEDYDPWLEGGWSWGEELHGLRYGTSGGGFTDEQRMHFDGLVVLMNLVRQVSNPPEQNRLVCLKRTIRQLGPYKHCPDTVMLVHDLGATFGKRQPDSLAAYRAEQVWIDAQRCEAALPAKTHDEHKVEHYTVGEAGRRFVVGLLDQLTDEHLRALFESAGFEEYDRTLAPSAAIEAWVAAFRGKMEQVQSANCTNN